MRPSRDGTGSRKARLQHIAADIVVVAATLLGSAVLQAAALGQAQQGDAANLQVTATVLPNCRILSVRDIDFGQLDPARAGNSAAQGTVRLACTRGVDFSLDLDRGEGFDTATGSRALVTGSGDRIPYVLERDTFPGRGEGFGNATEIEISARISGADYRDKAPGAYRDTLRLVLQP